MFDPNQIKLNVKILQKAMIFGDKGKFLTIKRAGGDFSRPNTWDFPGGWIIQGENPDEAMDEKVLTETGLICKSKKLGYMTYLYDKVKAEYTFFLCYEYRESFGKIRLSDEHTDHRWVDRDEFLKLKSVDYLQEFAKQLA